MAKCLIRMYREPNKLKFEWLMLRDVVVVVEVLVTGKITTISYLDRYGHFCESDAWMGSVEHMWHILPRDVDPPQNSVSGDHGER